MEGKSDNKFYTFFVGLLVVLFGSGSWLAVNSLWVELPDLVAGGIPEGYTLASYLVIIIQIGNVGPLAFTLVNYLVTRRRGRGEKSINNQLEVPVIYGCLILGVVASLLLIFFWDATTYWGVFEEHRSTALLSLAFVLAIVSCTSSVTFIPFMVRLKSSMVTLFFVGQGWSALAPGLVAIGQGVSRQECVANHTYVDRMSGGNCTMWMSQTRSANFTPDIFFVFLCVGMSLSLLAFFLLNFLDKSQRRYAPQVPKCDNDSGCIESCEVTIKGNVTPASSTEDCSEKELTSATSGNVTIVKSDDDDNGKGVRKYSRSEYAIIFVFLAIANALSNSVLPSIQSYSCGAYGFDAYLMAATLGQVANPVACFAVMFWPRRSLVLVVGAGVLGMLVGGYCFMTALLSPMPPLQGEMAGVILVVSAWIIVGGVFAYVKALIGWILRNEPDNHRLLTWFGIITQIGSLVGALIMFPLVNVLNIFKPFYGDPCEGYPLCE